MHVLPRFIALLVGTIFLSACGGGGDGGGGGGKGSAAADKAANARCAAGDGDLRVDDVLSKAPPGHEIVAADEKAVRAFTDPMRRALGGKLRGFDTAVVGPRESDTGTLIILANTNEAASGKPGDDAVAGARDAAKENDGEFSQITVADRPAALVHYDKASQIALSLGSCSTALLTDVDRKRLQLVADALHAPS
jgi:hypothetical protein